MWQLRIMCPWVGGVFVALVPSVSPSRGSILDPVCLHGVRLGIRYRRNWLHGAAANLWGYWACRNKGKTGASLTVHVYYGEFLLAELWWGRMTTDVKVDSDTVYDWGMKRVGKIFVRHDVSFLWGVVLLHVSSQISCIGKRQLWRVVHNCWLTFWSIYKRLHM